MDEADSKTSLIPRRPWHHSSPLVGTAHILKIWPPELDWRHSRRAGLAYSAVLGLPGFWLRSWASASLHFSILPPCVVTAVNRLRGAGESRSNPAKGFFESKRFGKEAEVGWEKQVGVASRLWCVVDLDQHRVRGSLWGCGDSRRTISPGRFGMRHFTEGWFLVRWPGQFYQSIDPSVATGGMGGEIGLQRREEKESQSKKRYDEQSPPMFS